MVAVVAALDVGDLEAAKSEVWDRVAFMTRYGRITLTEAMTGLDQASANDFTAAVGRLIKQENAKRD
jgi:hypothetical protein